MPETEEQRAARKKREAEERRAKETPEERAERKKREAERAKETPEEREARKKKEAERAKETPEERAERKRKEAERAKETPEEREARKKKEADERRTKETPEERAERKKKEAERAKETPEQREARKKKEADERRAKETPEERAERKKREAERAKEKQEEDERRRQQREERPVIHKQATAAPSPTTKKPATESPAAPAHKPIQAQAPKQAAAAAAAADDDEGDDYDDDDFEEVIDQDSLADAIRATEAENARIRAAQLAAAQQQQQQASSSSSKSKSNAPAAAKGESRAGLDVDSLTRQKHKAQYDKDMQRALALRRLVDLDEVKFTICDISPQSQYEVFLRSMSGGAAAAASTSTGTDGKKDGATDDSAAAPVAPIANNSAQAPESRIDVEIQAERVSRKTRSVQAPDDLGLFPEGQTSKKSATASSATDDKNNNKDKESDDKRVTALDKRRVDTAALGAFMSSVFPCFRSLLDENDLRAKAAAGGDTGMNSGSPASSAAATKHAFSQSTPTVLKHEITAGRPVVSMAYSQLSPQYVVVAHGECSSETTETAEDYLRASSFPGVALLWNANDAARPDKVLVAPSSIADICLSPTKNFIVYGALKHGAVCVWDLREPEGAHGGSALRLGLRSPSYVSGWSSSDLHKGGLRRVLVSGYNSATGQRNADEAEQALTLSDDGEVVFWMLNTDDNRGGGGGHHHSHPHGGSAGSQLHDQAGLRSSGSFTMNSPSRRRNQAAAGADSSDLGMALNAGVHLYRAAALNALEDIRAKNAHAKSNNNDSGGAYSLGDTAPAGGTSSEGEFSGRLTSATNDLDISPTDASHLVVAGSTAVHHVSKFGSITAPSQYGTPAATPSTAVSCCPMDSRLMLVGYENGSVRLYLRDESAPAYTAQLSETPIVTLRWATNRRWIAFVMDAAGQLHVLDLAAANKVKPVATAAAKSDALRFTSFTVSNEERETRLAIGQADGVVTVHTVGFDSILPVQIQRNERWL